MIKICLKCGISFKTNSTKRKYCRHKCYSDTLINKKKDVDVKGYKNANWRGGKRTDKDGYILIHSPYHPFRDGNSYVREHRLIMECFIRRFVVPSEVVHHKNNIKHDNRIENLELMTKVEHDNIEESKKSLDLC